MRPEDTTLLQVLGGCFEKNEVWDGYWHRTLPLETSELAEAKFHEFHAEITRWKGEALSEQRGEGWQRADWGALRMKQAGRGLVVWIRYAPLHQWWHAEQTWEGEPLRQAFHWD